MTCCLLPFGCVEHMTVGRKIKPQLASGRMVSPNSLLLVFHPISKGTTECPTGPSSVPAPPHSPVRNHALPVGFPPNPGEVSTAQLWAKCCSCAAITSPHAHAGDHSTLFHPRHRIRTTQPFLCSTPPLQPNSTVLCVSPNTLQNRSEVTLRSARRTIPENCSSPYLLI